MRAVEEEVRAKQCTRTERVRDVRVRGEEAAEPEVAELHAALRRDEHVRRLDVCVPDKCESPMCEYCNARVLSIARSYRSEQAVHNRVYSYEYSIVYLQMQAEKVT